jgi:hypothetical protein
MTVQSTNTPIVVTSGRFNDPALQEAQMGGAIVDVDPLDEAIVDVIPMDETVPRTIPVDTNARSMATMFDQETSEELRTRWNAIQSRFVDEPRSAVQQADTLVSEVIEKITQMFANEHDSLEDQWHQSSGISTEDLRIILQHYRAFFNRLAIQIPA